MIQRSLGVLLGALLLIGCKEKTTLEPTSEKPDFQDSTAVVDSSGPFIEVPLLISGADSNSRIAIRCDQYPEGSHVVKNISDSLFSISGTKAQADCQAIVFFGQPLFAISPPTSFVLGADSLIKVKQIKMEKVNFTPPDSGTLGWVTKTDTLGAHFVTDPTVPLTRVTFSYLQSHLKSNDGSQLEFISTTSNFKDYFQIEPMVYDYYNRLDSTKAYYLLDHLSKQAYRFKSHQTQLFRFDPDSSVFSKMASDKRLAINDSIRMSFHPQLPYHYTILSADGDTLSQVSGILFDQNNTPLNGYTLPQVCFGRYPNATYFGDHLFTSIVPPHEEEGLCVGAYEIPTGEQIYFQFPRFRRFETVGPF